jgi:hypothetical protein
VAAPVGGGVQQVGGARSTQLPTPPCLGARRLQSPGKGGAAEPFELCAQPCPALTGGPAHAGLQQWATPPSPRPGASPRGSGSGAGGGSRSAPASPGRDWTAADVMAASFGQPQPEQQQQQQQQQAARAVPAAARRQFLELQVGPRLRRAACWPRPAAPCNLLPPPCCHAAAAQLAGCGCGCGCGCGSDHQLLDLRRGAAHWWAPAPAAASRRPLTPPCRWRSATYRRETRRRRFWPRRRRWPCSCRPRPAPCLRT